MFDNLKKYFKDNDCKVNMCNNQIHVVNYKKILIFDDNNIAISLDNKTLSIKGNNLIINKLMNAELLIKGNICLVEIR